MSKNHNKIFDETKFITPVAEEVAKEPEEVAPVLNEPTDEPITEEVVEKEVTVDGIVDGVDMSLNIRKEAEVKPNNQIGILGKGAKLIIVDPDKPVKNGGEEWYKVRLKDEDGSQDGYAMKKFIRIL